MRYVPAWLLLLALTLPGLSGCGILEPDSETTLTLYVGPQAVDCVGLFPLRCLLVKERPSDEWTYFSDPIEGFTFEPGYLYVLRVRRREIPDPPVDGSSYEYRLLKLVSKEPAGG